MALKHVMVKDFLTSARMVWGAQPDGSSFRYEELNTIHEYFKKEASPKDTYLAILAPYQLVFWERHKHHFDGWVRWESPLWWNTVHGRAAGNLKLLVLEKPIEN